jgi:ribosomal protein S18 acetylase RimI-like enzyme
VKKWVEWLVIEDILRQYLEIKSIKDLNEAEKPSDSYSLELIESKDFLLNKFLYKQVGKRYQWVDRLTWLDQNWIAYVSDKNLFTYILKSKENLIGYFELIFHENNQEVEIAYFGILEEYFGKKLGGFLLSEAIKKSFFLGANRTWVHTCSLDHKNAFKNYLSRGMTVFKSEILKRKTI